MVNTFTETQFGEDRSTQFRVIVITDPPTNTHGTHRQDRLQYTAPHLARSVNMIVHSGILTDLLYYTLYLTLPYHTGKTFYRLALRPLTGPMHIPELTVKLQNPQV